MRTDKKVLNGPSSQLKPSRNRRRLRNGLALAFGAALLSGTATPVSAATAKPTMWIDRIDGHYVVQGRHFPANANGHIWAKIGNTTGYKDVTVRDNGYFWLEFTRFTTSYSGATKAHAWIGGADVRASATLRSSGGSGSGSGSSTTTTQKPATTTTQKPSTTTTAPKATTTTAPKSTNQHSSGEGGGSTPSGQHLVFSDDFNGSSVDGGKWGTYDGKGNQGHGYRRPSAVSVDGGELRITGTGDVSGGLASRYNGKYGRYEVRAKVDRGNGFGSAILLWPTSERWPIEGEMDISEVPKGDRGFSGSYFHYNSNNTVVGHQENGDFSAWHTYALDWQPGKLTYYLDGKAVFTVNNGAVPNTNHFLALQFDVGAKGAFIPPRDPSTPSSVTMHVDYVRVYANN